MDKTPNFLEFRDRLAWRSWLEKHHGTESEAWIAIQKKGSELPAMTLDEAVEEALCYGWIDGQLRSRDEQAYLLRFSPRRRNSVWSMSNIQRVEKLLRSGAMREAGLIEVRRAKESGRWQAAMDRERPEEIPPELVAALRQKKGAIAAYRGLPDSKKKQYVYWIQSAKRDQTRRKRIEEIVKRVLSK
jgi:uncharacterized protein YdeI (YjbR/CyaY-like superfamily)